jgi:histidine phosphotransferase ChpT
MPELGETIRLVELVCARLCHDIGGLIGTVGNAVDMVADDAARDDEVLAFASTAARALTQRLRLLRSAWGPDQETIALTALIALVAPPLEIRRIGVDTGGLPPDSDFSGPFGRVLLNLILLACDCLPNGRHDRADGRAVRSVGPHRRPGRGVAARILSLHAR